MSRIPLNECRHGYTYQIQSRNLAFGVFNRETRGFVGLREKFGDTSLFTEFHYDTGPPFGTVAPLREIEECPVKDLREHPETRCSKCKKPMKHGPSTPLGIITWVHAGGEAPCRSGWPCAVTNKELFDYLKEIVKRETAKDDPRRISG